MEPGRTNETTTIQVKAQKEAFHNSRLAKQWRPDVATSSCVGCRRPFYYLFRRRHHCRLCGEVFCAKCSRFRVILIPSQMGAAQMEVLATPLGQLPYDAEIYRSCGLCFAMFLGSGSDLPESRAQSLSIPRATNAGPWPPMRERSQTSLTGLDSSVAAGPGSSNIQISAPKRKGANHARLFSSSLPIPNIMYCPVCSKQLGNDSSGHDSEVDIDYHIDACVKRSSSIGCVGDRYECFVFGSDSKRSVDQECSICYEPFFSSQQVAILNCLCQYHEPCIATWFLKGRGCPFHPKRPSDIYLQ